MALLGAFRRATKPAYLPVGRDGERPRPGDGPGFRVNRRTRRRGLPFRGADLDSRKTRSRWAARPTCAGPSGIDSRRGRVGSACSSPRHEVEWYSASSATGRRSASSRSVRTTARAARFFAEIARPQRLVAIDRRAGAEPGVHRLHQPARARRRRHRVLRRRSGDAPRLLEIIAEAFGDYRARSRRRRRVTSRRADARDVQLPVPTPRARRHAT